MRADFVDQANAPKSPARLAAEEAEAAGDTTALMNYYMNKAADKRQSRDREPQVDPREMPPRADPRESRHGRSHGKRARASGGMAPNGAHTLLALIRHRVRFVSPIRCCLGFCTVPPSPQFCDVSTYC